MSVLASHGVLALVAAVSLMSCTRIGFQPGPRGDGGSVADGPPTGSSDLGTGRDHGGDTTRIGQDARASGDAATADSASGLDAPRATDATLAPDAPPLPEGTSWLREFRGVNHAWGRRVAVDRLGNVYVAGTFKDQIVIGDATLEASSASGLHLDTFLASFAADGAYRWARHYGVDGRHTVGGLAVDSERNVYITGDFSGTLNFGGGNLDNVGGTDVFLAKFDSEGTYQWAKRFGGAAGIHGGYGVAVDAANRVYITGEFGTTIDFGGDELSVAGSWDMFLACFEADSSHRWSRSYGIGDRERPRALAVAGNRLAVQGQYSRLGGGGDATSNVGGENLTGSGATDIFVAVYATADGAHHWSRGFPSWSTSVPGAVAIDEGGNVSITGTYGAGGIQFGSSQLPTGGHDRSAYLARFTAAGAHVWSKRLGGAASGLGEGFGVTADHAGNVYATGGLAAGDADFGGGVVPDPPGISGGVYVVSYDATGNHRWSDKFGGAYGYGIALGGADRVVVTGAFAAPLYFGGSAGSPATGSNDGFLLRHVR